MGLFQLGDFTLHSGAKSRWKIECDALTNDDLKALAQMLSERLPPFGWVQGVPRGGLKLAEYLRYYVDPLSPVTLIVDDVLTTGSSMEVLRKTYPEESKVIGAVLFARGPCPMWVTPLFRMTDK